MYLLFRGNYYRTAITQRNKFLYDGHIKGERSQCQGNAPRLGIMHNFRGFFIAMNIVGNIFMFNHYPLRFPGSTGGIDTIGQIISTNLRKVSVRHLILQKLVQGQHFALLPKG